MCCTTNLISFTMCMVAGEVLVCKGHTVKNVFFLYIRRLSKILSEITVVFFSG